VRVGLLGAGLIGAYHAVQLNLAGVPNRIVAVHDPDRERAASLADGQGAAVCSSVEELVAACDAVFVCTWTSEHLRCVQAALDAGRPVFCEKPLSTDLGGAAEVAGAVTGAALPDAVGLVLRTSPAFLAVRELLADPSVGRVLNVVFRDDQYLPTQGMYASDWRGDRRRCGSGTLLEHSIHDLDILEWLLGPATSVSAHSSFFHGLDGVEDSVSVLFRFASGATATLASVWHDVLARPSQRRVEVFCERAVVTLEGDHDGPVRRLDDDGELVLAGDDLLRWLAGRGVELRSTEERFLAAVRAHLDGRTAPRVRPDVADALRAHVLADAVYRSAATGGGAVAVPAPET
jgi:predicted dehydrogenase